MSDADYDDQHGGAQNERAGRKPDFVAYNVRDGRGDKSHWNRVGAAWEHKDGDGMDVVLDSTPVDGVVTLRRLRDDKMQEMSDERSARMNERSQPRTNEKVRGRGRER